MWYYCQYDMYETTFHKRQIDTKEITAIHVGHCQVFNNEKNCYGIVSKKKTK